MLSFSAGMCAVTAALLTKVTGSLPSASPRAVATSARAIVPASISTSIAVEAFSSAARAGTPETLAMNSGEAM